MANIHDDRHAPDPATLKKSLADWKPGSESDQAKEVGSPDDFGVHVSRAIRGERDYTSRNTKASDPGSAQPWSNEHDGNRQSGAGGRDSGPGSASGGDVDTDLIGVGTGGSGVSISGPDDRDPGRAASDGSSAASASGGPATGSVPKDANEFRGTTFTGTDRSTADDAQGSDAATAPGLRDDDSFAGEVSSAEASGRDDNPDLDVPA